MNKIEWCDFRKGNSRIKSNKYILIYAPQHPNAKSKGHIYEHRYVMEKYLKRFLNTSEHIHHKNGNTLDNKINNLEILSSSKHAIKHYKKETTEKGIIALNKYAQKIKLPRFEIFCKCGCGEKIINRDNKCRLKKYKHGHNARGKHWRWHNGN